jgi:ribonuclease Z
MPMPQRYLTALLASYNGKMILVDCGEGTQVSMKMLGWGFKYIDAICFTHFHADHIVGLPGLLLTIANSGRTEELKIIGPIGLIKVIEGLSVICPNLPYPIELIECSLEESLNFTLGDYLISTLPVDHGIPCLAYSIEIVRGRKFNKAKAERNKVPMNLWNRLQKGEIIEAGGTRFIPDMVLGEERKGIKVCYSTDTRPIDAMINFIEEADLFIGEGMYGDNESLDKAKENKHMLFSEAAELAKKGKVGELWLTHYSPGLTEPEIFLENAAGIFQNTKLGYDRMVKELLFLKSHN